MDVFFRKWPRIRNSSKNAGILCLFYEILFGFEKLQTVKEIKVKPPTYIFRKYMPEVFLMGHHVRRGLAAAAILMMILVILSVKMKISYREVFHEINGKVKTVIVLDAGHGGFDPGKVGVTGAKEKDINLAIALKVRRNLEHQGITVIMTREGDYALCQDESNQKKKEDMRKRVKIINESGAQLAVSIHQNSFTNGKYYGAQVFYYEDSKEGALLAQLIQKSFVMYADETNKRQEKANSDYYLLKNAQVPVVIAECGFLSNASEEAKLMTEAYQEKAAWAIHMGIMTYLNREQGSMEEQTD